LTPQERDAIPAIQNSRKNNDRAITGGCAVLSISQATRVAD